MRHLMSRYRKDSKVCLLVYIYRPRNRACFRNFASRSHGILIATLTFIPLPVTRLLTYMLYDGPFPANR